MAEELSLADEVVRLRRESAELKFLLRASQPPLPDGIDGALPAIQQSWADHCIASLRERHKHTLKTMCDDLKALPLTIHPRT